MQRTMLALAVLCAFVVATWPPFSVRADIAVIRYPVNGSTSTTTATSGVLFPFGVALSGQARCTLNLVDTATASVTVTGTADGTNYLTNTNFGSSGVISVTSTQSQTSGDVSSYPVGFNATITANAGTLTYSVSCGPAQTASSGGGGSYPSPAPTDANGNVKTALESPVPLPVTCSTGGGSCPTPIPWTTASPEPVTVVGTTPSPYPTDASGNLYANPLPSAAATVVPPTSSPQPNHTALPTESKLEGQNGSAWVPLSTAGVSSGIYLGVQLCTSANCSSISSSSAALSTTENVNANAEGYVWNGTSWLQRIGCTSSVSVSITSATTTQLVALSSGKNVYICQVVLYDSSPTVADTIAFEYGTGTNCGTGTTALTGAMSLGFTTATAPVNFIIGSPYGGPALSTYNTTGQALCVVTTGTTVGLAGWVLYAQF